MPPDPNCRTCPRCKNHTLVLNTGKKRWICKYVGFEMECRYEESTSSLSAILRGIEENLAFIEDQLGPDENLDTGDLIQYSKMHDGIKSKLTELDRLADIDEEEISSWTSKKPL